MTSLPTLKREIEMISRALQLNQPKKIIIQLVNPDDNSIVYEEWTVTQN